MEESGSRPGLSARCVRRSQSAGPASTTSRTSTVDIPRDKLVVHHRAVGLGQVVAGLRHALRRGAAPLRRVALGLRPPVPRADGEARRRLDRGALAGDLHRAEDDREQPALDRRHRHRDLRLPARCSSPASAGRTAPSAGGRSPRQTVAADGRPRAGAARGHALPGARAGGPRPQGRAPRRCSSSCAREGFVRARVDGEMRGRSPSRPSSTRSASTRSRSSWTGSSCGADLGDAPGRFARDRAQARRGRGAGRADARASESMLYSPSSSPARTAASRFAELTPRLFSFNTPHGACPTCTGSARASSSTRS